MSLRAAIFYLAGFIFCAGFISGCKCVSNEKKKILDADNAAIRNARAFDSLYPQTNTALPADYLPMGYAVHRFGVEDGLLNNVVDAVAQDAARFLWIKNGEGLTKYDGRQFVNFKPEISFISSTENFKNQFTLTQQGQICYPAMNGEVAVDNGRFVFHNADSLMMTVYSANGKTHW